MVALVGDADETPEDDHHSVYYKTRKRVDLPTNDIWYNREALVLFPAHESFRYLGEVGVHAALAGRKGSVGPGTADVQESSAPRRSSP
jgi:hypothetical protein